MFFANFMFNLNRSGFGSFLGLVKFTFRLFNTFNYHKDPPPTLKIPNKLTIISSDHWGCHGVVCESWLGFLVHKVRLSIIRCHFIFCFIWWEIILIVTIFLATSDQVIIITTASNKFVSANLFVVNNLSRAVNVWCTMVHTEILASFPRIIQEKKFIYLRLIEAKRNERDDKWFPKFPSKMV